MLHDFMDGNRSVDDVVKEVIEETDIHIVDEFLEDLTIFLPMEWQPNEGQPRLMSLLARIQKSKSITKVDLRNSLYGVETELVDMFNCTPTFVFH